MKKAILLILVSIIISGCSITFNTGGESKKNLGGMFFSNNKGDTWISKSFIPTKTGKPSSINSIDSNDFIIDPSDRNTFYFASVDNGLFFSYDQGENWHLAKNLGKINIKLVAVDYKNKCIIYVASGNKVLKSEDCARSWTQIYYDNDPAAIVSAMAIDHYKSENIFIGISRGDILKSPNRGTSWSISGKLNNYISKIVFSPSDSRVIFAGIKENGIFRSLDGGESWNSISDNLKNYKDYKNFRDLTIIKKDEDHIFLATKYGLFKSLDRGDTWISIDLITPKNESFINTITVNPKNEKEIYYATATTFFRTVDGGKTWTTRKLPTSRAGWRIIVDPENANNLFLTVKTLN